MQAIGIAKQRNKNNNLDHNSKPSLPINDKLLYTTDNYKYVSYTSM